MSRRTRFALVTISLAAAVLAGCSGGSDTDEAPPVASLRSAAAPSRAPADDQRVVYPVDATQDQIEAMAKPWVDCLKKEGVTDPAKLLGLVLKGGDVKDLDVIGSPQDAAAWKTCDARQPESFEQHQKRTDPTEFKDNQRQWYRCAQAAGYKLTAPDPESGEFGITEVGPNGDFGSEKMQECRRAAFVD